MEEKSTTNKNWERAISQLYGEAQDRQQDELNKLFDTLGMASLNLKKEGINFMEAHGMIAELKKMVKKFEVEIDYSVYGKS